jgi:Ca2+:H+ antiporter
MMRLDMSAWTWVVPALSLALLVVAVAVGVGPVLGLLCAAALIASVLVAVHHAEVVAHRVGEPFGTLVLALSVTVIEAALLLSVMFGSASSDPALVRDTIYAVVMIICNGIVGICILLGGLTHHEQSFRVEGAGAGLAALMVLSALILVVPVFTTTTSAGTLSASQLIFVAVASGALWVIFVFVQAVRHRDYFLPRADAEDPDVHAGPPAAREAWMSFVLLLASLVAVVGLAKKLSPAIERLLERAGAPDAALGIVIAIVVLMPEAWAALRAARANRLQTSMNLAIGSALATIGLTVPVVVVTAIAAGLPLTLGLAPKDMIMLALTFLVITVTLGTGRTHMMQGAVHLVIFGAFLFLTFVG